MSQDSVDTAINEDGFSDAQSERELNAHEKEYLPWRETAEA